MPSRPQLGKKDRADNGTHFPLSMLERGRMPLPRGGEFLRVKVLCKEEGSKKADQDQDKD